MRRTPFIALMLCFGSVAMLLGAPKPAIAGAGNWDQPQQPQYTPQDPQQAPPQNQQPDQGQYPQDNAGYQNYSPDQLDNLLSPIALYPDPLLAQVFVAATFPDQVEEAARFVRGYGTNGVDSQNWDVSVRSVAHYPTVIGMMSDKIDWTTSLGQAYVNQSTDVAAAVQRLRHMARRVGNLESTPQEEVLEHDDYIAISPYQPQFIYVPVYDPAICYYRRPYWGPAITFGVGFPIGPWLNLDFRWGFGGGWGGVYYHGWNRGGWGGGCWNCGWIGRSYNRIDVHNNVYINNRYNNITVNRTVINRNVNVHNINNYNSIHKNVNYNNVQVNNTRINNRAGGNQPGNFGRPGNQTRPVVNSPAVNNKIMDRNIDRDNPRIDQYRGRDNTTVRSDRPANVQQRPAPQQTQNRPQPQTQNRPVTPPQQQYRPPAQNNSGPHTFNRSESNFDPRASSQRGQASRQQAQQPSRPAPQASRPAPQANRPAPQQHGGGGGERRKP
jgi:Protein of unknown function (DUF3300)